jgi:hypothetical protein
LAVPELSSGRVTGSPDRQLGNYYLVIPEEASMLPEHLNGVQFGSMNASGGYLQLAVKGPL